MSRISGLTKKDDTKQSLPKDNTINNYFEDNKNKNSRIPILVNNKEIAVKYNTRVSELHLSELPCGGHGKCGKCKVKVTGDVSSVTEHEKELLTEREIQNGIRLACYTLIHGVCSIEKIANTRPTTVLTGGSKPQARLRPAFKSLGAAIDIGTTTLAARLLSPSGEILSEYGANNPQLIFGADVVSRIEAHLTGSGKSLSDLIVNAIDNALVSLCEGARKTPLDIDGIVITGNTVMLYLLTNTSPQSLSHAPFTLTRSFGETLKASKLNICSVLPNTEIYLPPCISAFIGADTVCAILAAATLSEKVTDKTSLTLSSKNSITYLENKKTAVIADIGTNGEMALWKDGQLYVCSTAAGPAFEGVGISWGMRGEPGAIDKVTIVNGELNASIIGGGKPKGICGSGLIDAVAALLNTEELDEAGNLENDEVTVLSPITITAKDIRSVQLAKSAINAGILTLINEAKIKTDDVSTLYIAGGFGNYLNKVSAGRIGLIPSELVKKTKNIGNAALIGAEMLLLNTELSASAEQLSKKAVTVELSGNKYFSEIFISGMRFSG